MHHLLEIWFGWVLSGGYVGIIILMAMGSTPLPVPAEAVLPPAAFLAAQGKLNPVGVILAGTLGAYLGSFHVLDFAMDRAAVGITIWPLHLTYSEQARTRRKLAQSI